VLSAFSLGWLELLYLTTYQQMNSCAAETVVSEDVVDLLR